MPERMHEEQQQHQKQQARQQDQATIEKETRGVGTREFESEQFDLIDANVASISPVAKPKVESRSVVAALESSAKSSTKVNDVQQSKQPQQQVISGNNKSREVNNNESIVADRNKQQATTAALSVHYSSSVYTTSTRQPLLPGLKMDASSLRQTNRCSAADSSLVSTQTTTTTSNGDSKQQSSSSVPSYSSIFKSSTQAQNKTQQQKRQQQQTDLDQEILSSSNLKLSTVLPPAQKQHWHAIGSRAPLKKQTAATDSGNSKRLLVFNYEPNRGDYIDNKEKISYISDESMSYCDENDAMIGSNENEDDEDESDHDDRLPSNQSTLQLRSSNQSQIIDDRRTSLTSKTNYQNTKQQPGSANKLTRTGGKNKIQRQNSIRRSLSNSQIHNKKHGPQHSKISCDDQQQEAIICQQLEHKQTGGYKKLNQLEQVAYLNCECNTCIKKRKLTGFVQGNRSEPALAAPSYYAQHSPHQLHHQLAVGDLSKSALLVEKGVGYPKTRILHLVLKSIILVLCTLLLLLLLVGTVMLTLTLPQAVDKITNVSRSFNVTIAGRR